MPEENRRLIAISAAVKIIGAAARLSRRRPPRAAGPVAHLADRPVIVASLAEVERAEVERAGVERAGVERAGVERAEVEHVERCRCGHPDSTGDSDFALFNTRSLFRT